MPEVVHNDGPQPNDVEQLLMHGCGGDQSSHGSGGLTMGDCEGHRNYLVRGYVLKPAFFYVVGGTIVAMDPAAALGRAIESEMLLSGLKRGEFARVLDLKYPAMREILIGETDLPMSRLRQIAAALETTPQELLDRADRILGRVQRSAVQANSGGQNVQVVGDGGCDDRVSVQPVNCPGLVTVSSSRSVSR